MPWTESMTVAGIGGRPSTHLELFRSFVGLGGLIPLLSEL